MASNNSYKQTISSVQRRDLMDYFPSLAKAFAGYIRQMVFQMTLKDVLTVTQERVMKEMEKNNYEGSLSPLFRDTSYEKEAQNRKRDVYYALFRKTLYYLIEQTDWYRWNNDDSYAKRSEAETAKYTKAALYAVPKHFFNKKAGEKAGKWGGEMLDKGMSKNKLVGYVKGYASRAENVSKITNGLFDPSINPMGAAIEKVHDFIAPDGVDTDFNNDTTRSYYANMFQISKKNDWIVGWGLESVDFATDWVKYADVLKAVEEVSINLFTAVYHAIDADREYAAIVERDAAWKSLTEEIKQRIHHDIASLTDEELTGLCKLLKININQ